MKKAFTLIELLVVIAVIAVLAGILFPVLAKARERARSTQCVNNLRQIGNAMDLYMGDWDERYPWAFGASDVGSPILRDLLTAYGARDSVWQCPSDYGETYINDGSGYKKATPPLYQINLSSYIWTGRGYDIDSYAKKPRNYIVCPTLTPLVWETRPWHDVSNKYGNSYRLPDKSNTLYCDGHIGRLSLKELWDAQGAAIRARKGG